MTRTPTMQQLDRDFDELFGSHVLSVILPPIPLATLPPELSHVPETQNEP